MKSVFIVDDEFYVRSSFSTLIDWKNLGCLPPKTFSNGQEALWEIKKNTPDLIITDIKMPIMNGLTLVQKIRELNKDIKVIILSAYSDFSFAKSAMPFGILRYLIKPVSIEDINTTISEILFETPTQEEIAKSPLKLTDYVDKYISNHMQTASLRDVAAALEISSNHLSKIYHEETGITFKQALTKKRMETAIHLIENGVDEKEASFSIGYLDLKSFKHTLAKFLKGKII